jgi:hypothetical protein
MSNEIVEFIKEVNALCEKYKFFLSSSQTGRVEVSKINGNKVVGLAEVYEFPAEFDENSFY